MEWRADLESTCAALGTYDGIKYQRDDECIECVKDLIRFLRRDDDSHQLRRSLGQIGVVQSDLIPLLRDYSDDEELLELVLRLMVNLTGPELLLFREELPQDKVTRNHFIELQNHRQAYKKAFVDEKLWAVLTTTLGSLLRKDYNDRSEDDGLVIERILILVRNVLQVPRDVLGERRTDDEASIHDQVLWVLHKSGMEDLMLFIASSEEETQYCLHVLEIISLMFREQDPNHLASANFQRSKEEKDQDEMALLRLRESEMEKSRQKFRQIKSTRHSRFGGTFTVANVKSISERTLIIHQPLAAVDNINFDKDKRPKKLATNKRTPGDLDSVKRRSTLAIRLFLKEFCVELLHGAYNKLMSVVKDSLVRQKAQNNDETYYLWSIKFFMEFNRAYKFRPDLVFETLNKSTFHYCQNQIEAYKDSFEHEKRNRPMCIIWARRIHLAVRAYQELLLNVTVMVSSKDDKVRQSGMVLRSDVFYESEYRELCLQQLSLYQPEKMSMSHLKDIVETTHVFLKLMEHMSKSSHVMVSSKKVRKKTTKKSGGGKTNKTTSQDGFVGERETNEQSWDVVSSELSQILQGRVNGGELPEIVAPFDATSDVKIDDQRNIAMLRIQDSLRENIPGIAVALLRASREVWPENDAFGANDAEPEDEYIAMREILFADIPRPAGYKIDVADQAPQVEGENENILEQPEIDEEDEEDEGEETMVTTRVEQEFDFNSFLQRFAVQSVCSAYAILFANYDKNTDHTNHCIIKMFHRIAWDMKLPALLFHVAILRVFQRIHRDYKLAPSNTSFRELNRFAKFVLEKFFEVAKTNKHIWMESCFWKNSREASEIVDGYGTQASTKSQKASFWCEEDEEKLIRVFTQLKEMQTKEEDGDLLDSITAFFTEAGKSRRQVATKLKQMALIANVREVTKKPLKMKTPREWGEDEVDQLKKLYEEFKDAINPVKMIIEHLTIKRPKKRVVEKIMGLGICDDKKRLMKKRVRRGGLKEGDAGYLEAASESDSALEDSGSESDQSSDAEGEEPSSSDQGSSFSAVAEKVLSDEGCKPALTWLKSCFDSEIKDREEDDDEDAEDVPILPMTEECILAMEKDIFLALIKKLQLVAPNEQEQYWRIPASISVRALATKAKFLERLMEGNFDLAGLEIHHLYVTTTDSSTTGEKKKPKKPKKRGPNKWLPMRREDGPDPDAVASKLSNDQVEKSSAITPKRRILQNDSSSSDEEDKVDENSELVDEETNEQVEESAITPKSSDDEVDNSKIVKAIAKSKKKSKKSSPVAASKNRIESDSSDSDEGGEGNKSRTSAKKARRRLASSSSEDDDRVDDPLPTERVPSDMDQDTLTVTTTDNFTKGSIATNDDTRASSRSNRKSRSPSLSSSDDEVDNSKIVEAISKSKSEDNAGKKKIKKKSKKSLPVAASKSRIESDSIDSDEDGERNKSRTSAKKARRRLASSSSENDDVVDDPLPTERVPSDTDQETSTVTTMGNITKGSIATTRASSRSSRKSRSPSLSSLSSRSSSRSSVRSVSRSPIRMISSTSNTPKRPRSSPSPQKSLKKAKMLTYKSSSSDDDTGHSPTVKKQSAKRILSSNDED